MFWGQGFHAIGARVVLRRSFLVLAPEAATAVNRLQNFIGSGSNMAGHSGSALGSSNIRLSRERSSSPDSHPARLALEAALENMLSSQVSYTSCCLTMQDPSGPSWVMGLIGWLIGWQIGWQIGWLIALMIG